MKSTIGAVAALCLLCASATSALGAIQADIVFVVDESGSMGTVQANVRNNIGTFASILSAGGIDGQYALVGYGSSSVRPHLLTNFTTPAAFATAAQGLVINGGTEPAYEGIMSALNGGPTAGLGLAYRPGAVKNIIIITDEVSNGDLAGANFVTANALLTLNNALLNGILSPTAATGISGGGTLGNLVTLNGGSVFSLNTFNTNNQAVINQFVQDFADAKLQEIQAAVPEPASVVAWSVLGVFGLAAARRRRKAA